MTRTRSSTLAAALRRRWPILPLLAVVFTLAAAAMARTMPPTFEAEALLRIDLRATNAYGQPADGLVGQYLATMLTSSRTLTVAAKSQDLRDLGFTPSQIAKMITATPIRGTDIVAVRARSSDPIIAARIATSVAQAGIEQNRREADASLVASRRQVAASLAATTERLIQLRTGFGAPALGGEMTRLQLQYVATLARQQTLAEQVATRTDAVSLLQAGIPPSGPSDPDLRTFLVAAGILALAIGTMLALTAELLLKPAISAEEFGEAVGVDLVVHYQDAADLPAAMSLAGRVVRRRFPGAKRILLSTRRANQAELMATGPASQELVPALNSAVGNQNGSPQDSDVLIIVCTSSGGGLLDALDTAATARSAGTHQIAALLLGK